MADHPTPTPFNAPRLVKKSLPSPARRGRPAPRFDPDGNDRVHGSHRVFNMAYHERFTWVDFTSTPANFHTPPQEETR